MGEGESSSGEGNGSKVSRRGVLGFLGGLIGVGAATALGAKTGEAMSQVPTTTEGPLPTPVAVDTHPLPTPLAIPEHPNPTPVSIPTTNSILSLQPQWNHVLINSASYTTIALLFGLVMVIYLVKTKLALRRS